VSVETVQGQQVAMDTLRSAIAHDRVGHAYLFVGPDGVGKRLAARQFAKSLNCLDDDDGPCERCSVCRRIGRGVHPDVIEIAPREKVRQIKTKVVDAIIETAAGSPLEARRKVFIILDADRMNLAAANKFLKTLEEPPGASVFVLVTSRPGALPPTVLSRCQRVRFSKLPHDVIADILEKKHGVSRDDARVAARLSGGRAGRALDLAVTDRRHNALGLLDQLIAGHDPVALAVEAGTAFRQRRSQIESETEKRLRAKGDEFGREELATRIETEVARAEEQVRAEIDELLEMLLSWCRDVVVVQTCGETELVYNLDRMDQIKMAAQRFDSDTLMACMDNVGRASRLLDTHIRLDRVLRTVFVPIAVAAQPAQEVQVQ